MNPTEHEPMSIAVFAKAPIPGQAKTRMIPMSWRWAEPEILWDVDRPEDLDRLRASGLLDDWFQETSP